MEIRHTEAASCPLFALDMGLRDALSAYARHQWPTHTAKMAAREWDLTLDEAKGLIAGRTSVATLEKIMKHPRGRLAVFIPVICAMTGESIHQFVAEQKKRAQNEKERYAANAARFGSLARDLPSLLDSPDRSFARRGRMDRKRSA